MGDVSYQTIQVMDQGALSLVDQVFLQWEDVAVCSLKGEVI